MAIPQTEPSHKQGPSEDATNTNLTPPNPTPDPSSIVTKYAIFPNDSQFQWWQDTGLLFSRLLQIGEYTHGQQYQYLLFMRDNLIPALGPCPQRWRSVITRSDLPIEYSLNFQESNRKPLLRIGYEPVSVLSGTNRDPFNQIAIGELVDRLSSFGLKGFDTVLFRHFANDFFISEREAAELAREADLGADSVKTQAAFGFDLKGGDIVPKGYVFTKVKARATGIPVGRLIADSVAKLDPQMQCANAVNLLTDYMESSTGFNEYTFLSWDFVDVSRSRLKFHGVHNDVSLTKVEEMWTLAGRLDGAVTLQGLELIERLWKLLNIGEGMRRYHGRFDDGIRSGTEDVPSPVVWNYEIQKGCDHPIPKLYFPVHGENDLLVARGLAEFFESVGWLEKARGYVDSVRYLYPEKDISQTSRQQSWVSFAYTEKTGVI